jgi:membrane peptidoglycan carboxypeptidase
MSIEDKKNNESLEEDTAKHGAVSGGSRKNKKQRQPSSSNTNKHTTDSKVSGVSHEERPAEKTDEPSITTPEAPKEAPALKSEKADQPAAESAPSAARTAMSEAKATPLPQPSVPKTPAPAIPRRPQAKKDQGAAVVPRRPQAGQEQQAGPVVPRRPQARNAATPPIPPLQPQPEEQAALPLAGKQVEQAATPPAEADKYIADLPTTTIPASKEGKQPGKEENAQTDHAQKEPAAQKEEPALPEQKALAKDITEQPTTAMAGQKAAEEPAKQEKHIADISTAAISKQEVQKQLAAAKAKKELEARASRVTPKPAETKKDIAEQSTVVMPEHKVEKQNGSKPPAEAAKQDGDKPSERDKPKKDVADISTTAISKKEVQEQIAAARAQKEASKLPPPEPESRNGSHKKAVAVLTRPPEPPARVVTATRTDPISLHRMRVNRMLIRKKRHERTKDIAPRLVTVAAVILIIFTTLFSAGAGAAYGYYQAQLPLLNGIAGHSLFQTTHIYDRNGKLIYELYDQQLDRGRRTYVNYKDISPQLVDATTSIEDRTFWTNDGVDPVGIARATFAIAQSGDVQGGGSTVTQQLIKKQLFDNQPRTFQLKMEEALLAAGLTQQYPKWKIMEMYLNTVYYGNINYGAEAAAQDYFGLMPKCDKTHCIPAVAQLDLAQAAMLAGLPQSPTYYAPTTNKPVALVRQKAVLQAMVDTGKITQAQANKAADEMAKYKFVSHFAERRSNPQAPHFVNYVVDQLTNLLGAQTLVSGGFNVYTTLDLDLEKKVEQIVYSKLYQQQNDNYLGFYGVLSRDKNVNNGAVVVMNPANGEILAMDGSANYNANNPKMNGQVNAALALRQPGSSMKPIVYATAFEMGWSPGMIIPDHQTTYPYPDPAPPKYYTPHNYDNKFHTDYPMTARTAIANSFNIPALDTAMFTGIPNILNMAGRLGVPEIGNLSPKQVGVSIALGAKEASLLHMTNAYGTFANQGMHVPPTSILEITDNQGRALYKYNESHPQGTQAIGSDVAFMVSSMLSDKAARYHEFGPGNPLELDRPAAAKTGTTDNFADNWTIGYTPHLAVGVWVGNSNNEQMYDVTGITGAGPIWHDVMQYANDRYKLPPDDFVKPKNVHAGTVSATTGLVPRPGETTVTDWYIDGTLPTIQGSNYSMPVSCTGKKCKKNKNNDNNN